MNKLIPIFVLLAVSKLSNSQANLIYFNGAQVFQYIDLTWGTSSETNTDYFTIERGLDGINFSPVLTVPAIGNSTSNTSYVRTDSSSFVDTCYYYRLKVTMIGGSFNYLDTISVCYAASTNGVNENVQVESLSIFPNPASNEIKAVFNSLKPHNNGQIRLISSDGREVYKDKIHITSGENMSHIQLQNISSGIYFLEINAGDFVTMSRLMVIK